MPPASHCLLDYFRIRMIKFFKLDFILYIISNIILIFIYYDYSYSESGNRKIESFSNAKKILRNIYSTHHLSFYCEAKYDYQERVCLPIGFNTSRYKARAHKVEWEHVVPAENFGVTFSEWRTGHKLCIHKGKKFKGRRCAEKVSREYRLMQADMYNLYPVIGAVNALRRNYNFQLLPNTPSSFGSCQMKISGNHAEPPPQARGAIARTYLYMQANYPRYRMSIQQEKLMKAWDRQYPVNAWECTRSKRIEEVQGNPNDFVKSKCIEDSLWY